MDGRDAQEILIVLVTVPNADEGVKIGSLAVQSRLAACVNVIPAVESIFWWQGKISKEQEALIILKTSQDRYKALQEMITKHHPYEVPEVVAIPVAMGLPQYLGWVEKETHSE